jgi:iron complex transport system permease protein
MDKAKDISGANGATGIKRMRWLGSDQVSLRLAAPAYSARISVRVVKVCVCLLAVIVLLVALNVSLGQYPLPLTDVLPSILGLGDSTTNFIVQTLRLPRSLDAVLVGIAFGMSGALFQSVMRNPLASPDVLGVEAGAAAAAVFMIVTAGRSGVGITGGALLGGLGTALAVYVLAYKRAGMSGYRLMLIGISVAAALYSVTVFLLTRASTNQAQEAAVWLNGSLSGRGWGDLLPVGLALVVLLPLAPLLTRQLLALQLGDDTARGLGVRVEASRLALILAGAVLAAAATASAGPLLFVALVSPQLARRIARTTTGALIPAALIGAALVCAADLIGRLVIAPTEEPVGVVTAILGAPYLLWYLTRSNRAGARG